jgi:hypothetical protein
MYIPLRRKIYVAGSAIVRVATSYEAKRWAYPQKRAFAGVPVRNERDRPSVQERFASVENFSFRGGWNSSIAHCAMIIALRRNVIAPHIAISEDVREVGGDESNDDY